MTESNNAPSLSLEDAERVSDWLEKRMATSAIRAKGTVEPFDKAALYGASAAYECAAQLVRGAAIIPIDARAADAAIR